MVRLHEVMIDNNTVMENKHKSATTDCTVIECISFSYYFIRTFWVNFNMLQTLRNNFRLMSYSKNLQFIESFTIFV